VKHFKQAISQEVTERNQDIDREEKPRLEFK
jgi:hypothetical protein